MILSTEYLLERSRSPEVIVRRQVFREGNKREFQIERVYSGVRETWRLIKADGNNNIYELIDKHTIADMKAI